MSQERADVRSIEVIDRFRVTLAEFVDAGRNALIEAESDLDRTIMWLDRDRVPHWTRQIRRREELVTRAKSELYRKQTQLSAKDGRPSVVEEQQNLRRAVAKLEEARRRLEATRTWIRRLERERTMYRAAVSAFAGVVEVDLPHAIGLLHRMSENLEAYVGMPPPDLARALSPPEQDPGSMRRSGTESADMEISEVDASDDRERTEEEEHRP
jgi:hypothetical protein